MFKESPAQGAARRLLQNNEQHMRRRVHRLRAVLSSPRWRSRPIEKNLRLLWRCALTLMPATLAQATFKVYWQRYLSRKKAGRLYPGVTLTGQPTTKPGSYYNRAVLRFGFASELVAWLTVPEEMRSDHLGVPYPEPSECASWLGSARALLRVAPPGVRVDRQSPPPAPKLDAQASTPKAVPAVKVRQPKTFKLGKSKRDGLSTLGKRWRQIFWKHVSARGRYRHHIAALLLTGARPCEFEGGMRVRLVSTVSGDRLVFLIRGRKKTETTGLTWRRVVVDIPAALQDPNRAGAVHDLVDQLQRQPRHRMVLECNAKALNATVSDVGKKAFPRKAYKVAPYSFRHQLATDIKVADLDEVEFARILSHASTRTADHYGFAARGRTGKSPVQSLPVRSGGARGVVRIKHSAPPNWPAVRTAQRLKSGTKKNAKHKRS